MRMGRIYTKSILKWYELAKSQKHVSCVMCGRGGCGSFHFLVGCGKFERSAGVVG